MPDSIFENPRLVSIYDDFDGQRHDLTNYVNIVSELGANSIVDIGCGTGCLATLLASKGYKLQALIQHLPL